MQPFVLRATQGMPSATGDPKAQGVLLLSAADSALILAEEGARLPLPDNKLRWPGQLR